MEIKPCEKCGGWPYVRKIGDNKKLYIYECVSCGFVKAKLHEAKKNPLDALRIWNR